MTFLQAEVLLFHKRKEGQTDFAVIFQPMKMTFSGELLLLSIGKI